MIVKAKKLLVLLSLALLFSIALVYGAESSQDRFTTAGTQSSGEPLKGVFSRALEFPFQLIKWPIDQGLLFTEKHHLDKKTLWLYEQGLKYGFKPRFGTVDIAWMPYYGADLNFLALAGQKDRFPDFFVKGTVLHCPTVFLQTGAEIGAQRIGGTGFHSKGFVNYDKEEREPFYGIGPHSSRGDTTTYRMETTQVGIQGGYEFSPTIDLSGDFDYKHVKISSHVHDNKSDIASIFGPNVPGLSGDNLLGYTMTLRRDTRDSKDDATQGSYQQFLVRYTDGVNHSQARYFTYQLDMAKYFQLASPRRIFVARLFAECNDEVDHGTIPFYNMAKLGGEGSNPRESETSRAFVYNRFYGEDALLVNFEYRYTVMEYRGFKLKTALFSDTGQVFEKISKFQFSDFRESYGVGFYLSYAKNTVVNFSVAHGDEGTRFYVKNKLAF